MPLHSPMRLRAPSQAQYEGILQAYREAMVALQGEEAGISLSGSSSGAPILDRLILESLYRGRDLDPAPDGPGGLPSYVDRVFRSAAGIEVESEYGGIVLKNLRERCLESELSEEILAYIFELKLQEMEGARRKGEGAFYTPASVARAIVGFTLGPLVEAGRPSVVGPGKPDCRDTEVLRWRAYRTGVLDELRILDPSCGGGVFLLAALDFLCDAHRGVDAALQELGGEDSESWSPEQIVSRNLFGVDLDPGAVEVADAALWLRAQAQGGSPHQWSPQLWVGNALVDDSLVDPRALDWLERFPDIFRGGGFHAVVGNPPYVRQEAFRHFKPYLKDHFESYNGFADLYLYFLEKGISLLRPLGMLGFITPNKWFRVASAASLRSLVGRCTHVHRVVDFGHSPIFRNRDAFPAVTVLERLSEGVAPKGSSRVCDLHKAKEMGGNLSQEVAARSYTIPRSQLDQRGWSLERPEVASLMKKIQSVGRPLAEYGQLKPFRGILTGYNEAFLIEDGIRNRWAEESPKSLELLKPALKGTYIKRWSVAPEPLWLLVIPSSREWNWPWRNLGEVEAEKAFGHHYPSVYKHLKGFEVRLRARRDRGRNWWELRACSNYGLFERPRIVHTDIAWNSRFALCRSPLYSVNTAYLWPSDDPYLLAVANSPMMWSYMWRNAVHAKDEALRLIHGFVSQMPIAAPSRRVQELCAEDVPQLVALSGEVHQIWGRFRKGLLSSHDFVRVPKVLGEPNIIHAQEFVRHIKRGLRSRVSSEEELGKTREAYKDISSDISRLLEPMAQLERRVCGAVHEAYDLSREELELMWQSAPPRMPLVR